MKIKLIFTISAIAFILSTSGTAFSQQTDANPQLFKSNNQNISSERINPPKRIEYDGKALRYNPSWQNKETYIQTDLGTGSGQSIIISFLATYTPQTEPQNEKAPNPFEPVKKEIVMLENYAFYQIYTKGPGNRWILSKTIHGMDQLGNVKIFSLDAKKPKAIAIFSPGGENYTDLSIYQWQEGGFRLIFNIGSPQPIKLDTAATLPIIRIKKDTFEETWSWDNNSNNFKKIN